MKIEFQYKALAKQKSSPARQLGLLKVRGIP